MTLKTHHFTKHGFTQAVLFVLLAFFGTAALRGQSGNALHFDGIDDFVELGSSTFYMKSFTVEGWIRPEFNSKSRRGYIFHVRLKDNLTAIHVDVKANGTLTFVVRNPAGDTDGAFVLGNKRVDDGDWHHFAAVKGDDDKLYLYVDGKLDGTSGNPGLRTIDDFSNVVGHKVLLGMGNVNTNSSHFKGVMDEIRFWNSARPETDIQRDMNNTAIGSPPGLVAYYSFDQGIPFGNNLGINKLASSQGNLDGTLRNFQMTDFTSNFVSFYSMVNVALGKPASQSSTHRGWEARHAVDGKINGKYRFTHPYDGTQRQVDCFTHTTGSPSPPWWEVDLEEVHDIAEVKIWNRGDGPPLSNVMVMVAENPIEASDMPLVHCQ